jgi:hypothetical protein
MKRIWIITFALATLLASPISAQTPTPNGAAAQKPSQLPPIKVHPSRAATLTAHARGPGSGLTPGYVENDHNALKFGSKEWWNALSVCKLGC